MPPPKVISYEPALDGLVIRVSPVALEVALVPISIAITELDAIDAPDVVLVVRVIEEVVVDTPHVVPEGEPASVISFPSSVTSMSLKSKPVAPVPLTVNWAGNVIVMLSPETVPVGVVKRIV
jgi:hypothetical protein